MNKRKVPKYAKPEVANLPQREAGKDKEGEPVKASVGANLHAPNKGETREKKTLKITNPRRQFDRCVRGSRPLLKVHHECYRTSD